MPPSPFVLNVTKNTLKVKICQLLDLVSFVHFSDQLKLTKKFV